MQSVWPVTRLLASCSAVGILTLVLKIIVERWAHWTIRQLWNNLIPKGYVLMTFSFLGSWSWMPNSSTDTRNGGSTLLADPRGRCAY